KMTAAEASRNATRSSPIASGGEGTGHISEVVQRVLERGRVLLRRGGRFARARRGLSSVGGGLIDDAFDLIGALEREGDDDLVSAHRPPRTAFTSCDAGALGSPIGWMVAPVMRPWPSRRMVTVFATGLGAGAVTFTTGLGISRRPSTMP